MLLLLSKNEAWKLKHDAQDYFSYRVQYGLSSVGDVSRDPT